MLKQSSTFIYSRTFSSELLTPLNSTLVPLAPVTVINIWSEYYRCLRACCMFSWAQTCHLEQRHMHQQPQQRHQKMILLHPFTNIMEYLSLRWRQRVPCFPLKGQYVQLIYSTIETNGAQRECICRYYAQDFVFSLAMSRGISEGFTPMWVLRMVDMLSHNSCRLTGSFFSRATCYKTRIRTEGGTGKKGSHWTGVREGPAALYFMTELQNDIINHVSTCQVLNSTFTLCISIALSCMLLNYSFCCKSFQSNTQGFVYMR